MPSQRPCVPAIWPIPQPGTRSCRAPPRRLVPRWNEHPSGLLMPATVVPPAPIDLGAAYLTPDEIFGFELSADYAVRQLERLPLEGVIRFCARVLNALELPGASVQAVEAHFAGEWLDEPVRSRVRNLLRDETRRLLVPQALMLLARMAMEVSPDTVPDDLPDGDIVGALISLTQIMGRHPDPDPSVITDRPGTLGREIIANHHFHRSWSVPGVLARYARRWLQLPAEHQGEPGIVDLSQAYQDCTGARLEDLAAVAGYLWLRTTMGRFVIEPGEPTGLTMPTQRFDAVLALITNDLPGMRDAVRSERPEQTRSSCPTARRRTRPGTSSVTSTESTGSSRERSWRVSVRGCSPSTTASSAAPSAGRRPSGLPSTPHCVRTTAPCTASCSCCARSRGCRRR